MTGEGIRVLKFGGSSVQSAERLVHVASLIEHYVMTQGYEPVVVLSAMGRTTTGLIQCASCAARDEYFDFTPIEQLHMDTIHTLGLGDDITEDIAGLLAHCRNILRGVSLVGELSPATEDVIMSFGERMSVRIFAGLLRSRGLKAQAWDAFDVGTFFFFFF